ncbi:MAG: TetR/AcrR family transcriptional regulator [Pseudoxanthomonas suwonensis]|nr:TetR/AcrR family transcriptional regulator [Pseudoxanthomonas suwonensis]
MSAQTARGERVQAQRERILQAAQKCFTEHGFHAASMAAIAETAQMSPSLIYRYFEGKSQIIQGIVERQLELMVEDLARRQSRGTDLAAALFDSYYDIEGEHRFDDKMEPALVLETTAEASRDAQVGAVMKRFDQTISNALRDWLRNEGVAESMLDVRVFALRCFIDGLLVRKLRQPDLSPELLRQALSGALGFVRTA